MKSSQMASLSPKVSFDHKLLLSISCVKKIRESSQKIQLEGNKLK